MRHAVLLIALAVLPNGRAVAASASAPAEFRLVAQTKHARYWSASRAKVDVRENEAFLERLFALFGATPRGFRLDYYRHESTQQLATKLGFAAYGVTDLATSRIDSALDFHPHELVHAVAGPFGHPPLLFTEGLAVALTTHGVWRGRGQAAVARAYLAEHGTLRPLVVEFGTEDPDRDYAVAGAFVSFLLDRYGIERLVAFLKACGAHPARYPVALRAAYGATLADLERDWARWLDGEGGRAALDWYDAKSWPETLRAKGRGTAGAPPPTTAIAGMPVSPGTALEHAGAGSQHEDAAGERPRAREERP